MPHRERSVATRTTVTIGMAAALLAVPLSAAALGLDVESETGKLVDMVEESVEETSDSAEKTAKKATDTAEKVVKDGKDDNEQPPELAPADDGGSGGADKSGTGSGGGTDGGTNAAPTGGRHVRAAGSATPLDAAALASPGRVTGGQERGVASRPDLRSTRGSLSSWSRLDLQPPAPLVSAPFAYDAPVVASGLVAVPAVSSMGALEAALVATTATSAGGRVPAGIPSSLVAAAAGLVMLLGSAHALHASGRVTRA